MRRMIAVAAFLLPLLIAFHLMATTAETACPAAIGGPALAELRTWITDQRQLLDGLAPAYGQPDRGMIPDPALTRFDRCGCDRHGNAWFRLANRPPGIQCGVLHRAATDRMMAPGRTAPPRLALPLVDDWYYWEWREPLPAGSATRPQAGP